MPEEKNFFTGLFDFSFSHSLLRRLVKLLYVIAMRGAQVDLLSRRRVARVSARLRPAT